MKVFKNKCCRCGLCCINETCIIARKLYNLRKEDRCPALSFEGSKASCSLAGLVPIGDGCCIAARVFKNGVEYNFADLPIEAKIKITEIVRKEKGE